MARNVLGGRQENSNRKFIYPHEDEHSTLANAILSVGYLNHWKLRRTFAIVQELYDLEKERREIENN